MAEEITHIPVLLEEVLRFLEPQPGMQFADGTLGLAGHAAALLARIAPRGRLLGVERDPRNLAEATKRLAFAGDRAVCVRGSYSDLARLAAAHGFMSFDGILLDLGFSSAHVDDPSRGFSFMTDGPLDMRYDTDQEQTAATIVNGWTKDDLAWLFRAYGEEPRAAQIADLIVKARRKHPFTRTLQLAEAIAAALPRHGKIHPATLAFQALRIAVNDELGELERLLPDAIALLKPGGRLAIISFHSLEDRVVKTFFAGGNALQILTKKPVVPTDAEAKRNPRARSAKLRVARKNDPSQRL